jgi:DNA primase
LIKKESIQNLVESVDIVDVVNSYVDLRKFGIVYKSRCPFHDEKTPSFTVSPTKQVAHCFGCGWHGNSLNFIQDYEKLNFVEAVETLADRYSFQLQYEEGFSENYKAKEKIPALEKVNEFFIESLFKSEKAYSYLIKRGLTKETIKKFKLGYAPSSYEILSFFQREKISFKDGEEIGVLAFDERGNPYSRFTERVIFPIFSQQGKVIAFGGRTLSNHQAKYINSPTTALFNKSKTLYGYNFAKSSILKTKEMILVEGYLDVIMLHQVGIENAVAPLGTAMTTEHLPLIRRGSEKVILAFDGDKAGIEASFKTLDILFSSEIETRVSPFEEGVDPADLVKNRGFDEVRKHFENSKNGIEFYIDKISAKYDLTNPFQKNSAKKEIKERILSNLKGNLRDHYLFYTDQVLKISTPELSLKKGKINTRESYGADNFFGLFELSIIRTLLENRDWIDWIKEEISIDDFLHYGEIYQKIVSKDFENSLLQGVLIMNCNVFQKDEIRVEILNQKIRRVTKERENLIGDKNLSLKEKTSILREKQHSLISLKKERDRLENLRE